MPQQPDPAQEEGGGPMMRESLGRLTLFGALLALVLNVLKGARIPGRWVATHLQLDYHFGLLKRGLPGALAKALGVPVEKFVVASLVGIGYTLLCLVVIGAVVWACGLTQSLKGRVLLLVGCSSYGVAMMTHFVGYYDHLLFVGLGCSVVMLIRARPGAQEIAAFTGCTLLCAACILVHEIYVVLAGPIICLGFMLRGRVGMGVGFGVVALGMGFWMMEQGISPEVTHQQMTQYHTALVDFPLRHDVFSIYWRGIRENVRFTLGLFMERNLGISYLASFGVQGSAALLFLGASLHRLSAWVQGKVWWQRVLMVTACVLGSMGPHVMTFFGWDIPRWHAQSVVTSFLCMCLVWSQTKEAALPGRSRAIAGYVVVVVVVVNLMAGFGFFDQYEPTPTPFLKHIYTIKHYTEGDVPFFLPPPH